MLLDFDKLDDTVGLSSGFCLCIDIFDVSNLTFTIWATSPLPYLLLLSRRTPEKIATLLQTCKEGGGYLAPRCIDILDVC